MRGIFSITPPYADNGIEELHRLELDELLKGRAVPARGVPPWPEGERYGFTRYGPAAGKRTLGQMADFRYELYSDHLAAGRYAVRQFVLTNVRGRVIPGGETEELGAYILDATAEEQHVPKWSFTVHRYQGEWDSRRGLWQERRWIEEESIAVGFKEPFQVLGKGSDYYFLTASGKLYRAAKATKGKRRALLPVWTDARRRIVAHITDADTGRTFLFVKPASPRDKPTFFALAARPKPEVYDPALVAPPKAAEPLRSVLRYARLLVALKKIKPRSR
jgi:hypothetical protein